MKITWINPVPIVALNGRRTSASASVRLRSMIPGDELRRRGHDVNHIALADIGAAMAAPDFLHRDIFVFDKLFADFSPMVRAMRERSPVKIVVDICDNVFQPPEDGLRREYEALLPYADAITASSESLIAALRPHLSPGLPAFTIPDAVEGERKPAEFSPSAGKLRLLWFGYPNNLPLLQAVLPMLGPLAERYDTELAIVTDWSDPDDQKLFAPTFGKLRLRGAWWSPASMEEELKACDVVVIPSDASPTRITKSANRLITALWSGKYAVASPLPSYRPFGAYAGVSDDLYAEVIWALENAGAVRERIEAGQAKIETDYAPSVIADLWEETLQKIVGRK